MNSGEERLEEMLKAVMETGDGMSESLENADELSGVGDDMLVDPLALLDMSEEEIDKVLEKEAGIDETVLEKGETATQDEGGFSDFPQELSLEDLELKKAVDPGAGADTGFDPGAGLDVAAMDDLGMDSGVGLDMAEGDDLSLDPGAGLDVGSVDDLGMDSGVGLDMDAGDDLGLDIGTGDDLGLDPGVGLDIDAGADLDIGLNGELDMNLGAGMDVDLDSESVQSLLGLTDDMSDMEDISEDIREEPAEELREKPDAKSKKEKKKREKKAKKGKESPKGDKKEGNEFLKKLALVFFGSDEDELDDEAGSAAPAKNGKADDIKEKKGGKAVKKEKKKNDKKQKAAKKKEPDPAKAAKEKLKKEKNAEKAKKKAEKAEIAEKERRAAKKLPKKKVFVWILFCASIAAGVLLMNSVGMDTLQLTEARNAFDDKDFETAYQLLNGRTLAEEDQLLFRQSSAVLHLKHAKEAYENHLKLDKPVMALEDLLKGVDKYGQLSSMENLVTPELTAQYQEILGILQEEYALSESGAQEINALEDDYEFSLRLEALVAGEVYQSAEEIAAQEEEAAFDIPELEDMLPEEEEYLNDSGY